MDADSGEGAEWIVPGKNRRLVKPRRADRRVRLTKPKRKLFLEHLAATCNVTASAEAAGVSLSAVYRCRSRDPEFRASWFEAIEHGYARLELALLERALSGGERIAVDGGREVAGADSPDAVDWDKGLVLLGHHKRGLAGRPSTRVRPPQRVPIDEMAEKIVRKLMALGVRPPDGCDPAGEAPNG